MKSRRPKRFCLTVWTEQNYGYQFSSKLRPMLHSNISNEIDCPSLRLSNRGLRNMCEERDKIPRFTRISLSKLWSKRYSCESRDFIPFLAHGPQTAIRQSQRFTIDFVWLIGMQHWTQFRGKLITIILFCSNCQTKSSKLLESKKCFVVLCPFTHKKKQELQQSWTQYLLRTTLKQI